MKLVGEWLLVAPPQMPPVATSVSAFLFRLYESSVKRRVHFADIRLAAGIIKLRTDFEYAPWRGFDLPSHDSFL